MLFSIAMMNSFIYSMVGLLDKDLNFPACNKANMKPSSQTSTAGEKPKVEKLNAPKRKRKTFSKKRQGGTGKKRMRRDDDKPRRFIRTPNKSRKRKRGTFPRDMLPTPYKVRLDKTSSRCDETKPRDEDNVVSSWKRNSEYAGKGVMDPKERVRLLRRVAGCEFCGYCSGYLGTTTKYQPDCCEHNHDTKLIRCRGCNSCNSLEGSIRAKVYARWRKRIHSLPVKANMSTPDDFGASYRKYLRDIANELVRIKRVSQVWKGRESELAVVLYGFKTVRDFVNAGLPTQQIN